MENNLKIRNSATSSQKEMTDCILVRKEMVDNIEKIQHLIGKMGNIEVGQLHLQLLIIIGNIRQEQQIYCKSISALPYPDEVKNARIRENGIDGKKGRHVMGRNSLLKQGIKLVVNQEDEKKLLDPLKKDVLIEQRLLLEKALRNVILQGGESCDEALALADAIEDIDLYLKDVYN